MVHPLAIVLWFWTRQCLFSPLIYVSVFIPSVTSVENKKEDKSAVALFS